MCLYSDDDDRDDGRTAAAFESRKESGRRRTFFCVFDAKGERPPKVVCGKESASSLVEFAFAFSRDLYETEEEEELEEEEEDFT